METGIRASGEASRVEEDGGDASELLEDSQQVANEDSLPENTTTKRLSI